MVPFFAWAGVHGTTPSTPPWAVLVSRRVELHTCGGGASKASWPARLAAVPLLALVAVRGASHARRHQRRAPRTAYAGPRPQGGGAPSNVWDRWWTLPIYPYARRRTVLRELLPGDLWALEQLQGLLYVHVPVRAVVVRIHVGEGGLLIYAPVAPTEECIELVRNLERVAGPVRAIVLPSLAIEHKAFAGHFASFFPAADLLLAPDQYSFPLDLPMEALGFPHAGLLPRRNGQLPATFGTWAQEFEMVLVGPFRSRDGAFEEAVFFHCPTGTLLCVDLLQVVPEEPPQILLEDDAEHRALLYHARDTIASVLSDDSSTWQRGWQRIVLFASYFQPASLRVIDEPDGSLLGAARFFCSALRDAQDAPMASRIGPLGAFFPFVWQAGWAEAFDALRGGGRPFVPPILAITILDRARKPMLQAAEAMTAWPIQRLVGCHFGAPGTCSPAAIRDAFSFLDPDQCGKYLPEDDLKFLRTFAKTLEDNDLIPPVG